MNYADRVKDTSASVGQGAMTLFGAPITGFRSFLSAFPSGAVDVPYAIDDGMGNWEIGIGSFSDSVLTRTQVLSSSSNGGLVDFVAGKKSVICTLPADLVESATNRSIAAASESAGHAVQTAQDKAQTGLDRVATAADRVQTGQDAATAGAQAGIATTQAQSAALSAQTAADMAGAATTKAGEASASADTASTKASEAAASEAAAATSATNAAASATKASTSATAAASSANSALTAPGTSATSTTSNAIGTGSKTFTIQTGKAYAVGQFVVVAQTSNPANFMVGQITAYNSGTGSLTVSVSTSSGSGTITDWTVALCAVPSAYAVEQADVGTAPNQIPLNQYLGSMAFRDSVMAPVPNSATASGVPGDLAQDGSFLYICTAPNAWKRVALSSW